MVYKCFDKRSAGVGIKNEIKQNDILAEELQEPVIIKFEKRIVYSLFKENIWGDDLANMQLISKFNKGICFLLCVIDIFSKYAWVVPLKDEKGTAVTNAFEKLLDKSRCKPNKIWLDKVSEFYNKSMKLWLGKNVIKICSTHDERKTFVTERFIRTLKIKIYKYMTAVSKNAYFDKLDDIVKKG